MIVPLFKIFICIKCRENIYQTINTGCILNRVTGEEIWEKPFFIFPSLNTKNDLPL